MFSLSALTLVKLGVVLLGVFNLTALVFTPPPTSITEPRRIHIKNDPTLQLLHLDVPLDTFSRTLIAEETAHYAINGTLADLEWASLVPAGNHGLVLMGPDARPYAITMFHTLHCLDRIRRAILGRRGPEPDELSSSLQSRYHVHHCFNYVRQMTLCAANTRLDPINHVNEMGQPATDGIGLWFECRDWNKVYDTFEANYGLNRTMRFV